MPNCQLGQILEVISGCISTPSIGNQNSSGQPILCLYHVEKSLTKTKRFPCHLSISLITQWTQKVRSCIYSHDYGWSIVISGPSFSSRGLTQVRKRVQTFDISYSVTRSIAAGPGPDMKYARQSLSVVKPGNGPEYHINLRHYLLISIFQNKLLEQFDPTDNFAWSSFKGMIQKPSLNLQHVHYGMPYKFSGAP